MTREIKERGQVFGGVVVMTRIWQAGSRISQLIEERMAHSLNGRQSLCGCVFQEGGDQVDRLRRCLSEYLMTVSSAQGRVLIERLIVHTLLKGCGLI